MSTQPSAPDPLPLSGPDDATPHHVGPSGRHRLGRSRIEVSRLGPHRLGLGTAPLGGLFNPVEESDAHAVVEAALAAGLTYLDTAPLYGHGVAERRLGAALRGVERSSYVLSTKVGRLIVDADSGERFDNDSFADAPPSHAVYDYSRDAIHRSLEASLERLGLDRVDIVYIHDPDDHEDEAIGIAYPVLHELRAQGVVDAIGVGMNQSGVPTRFVRETEIDVVLLAGRYTLLDQSGAADLLPACVERGASVVIGGVYNSGLLADPKPGATYNYVEAPTELVARARHLGEVCAAHEVPLQAAAIQFPLAHPAVASVLTGVRTVAELQQNLEMSTFAIPDRLWSDLAAEGVHRP